MARIFSLIEHTGVADDLTVNEGARVHKAGVWVRVLVLG
jgi:hypothetical protein